MAARKSRLPGDAKITELVRGMQQRDPASKRLSPEALQERMRRTLSVPNPADNSARLAEDRECQIQLRVIDIDPYDRNPRRERNQLYAEIKESIRVAKVISPLTVTKRPGSNRYMVGAGGNTRLKAQRELWDETGDPRFEYLLVTYRPWVSEAQVLTAHLVENELHAGMSFWDKALGVWDLKQELEHERGEPLSLRQLNEAMRENGLALSVTMLSFYGFAIANLADLGPATRLLSTNGVRELQPVFAYLCKYVVAHGMSEEAWHAVRRRILQGHAPSFTGDATAEVDLSSRQAMVAGELIDKLEQAVAELLGQDPTQLRDIRRLLKTIPGASIEELLARHPPANEGARRHEDDADRPQSGSTGPMAGSVLAPESSASNPSRRTVKTGNSIDPDRGQVDAQDVAQPAASRNGTHQGAPVGALQQVQQAAASFAEACGIHDLLRLFDDMPCGFYVEVPAEDSPIDAGMGTWRHGAWWIAAMHSGQIDGSYAERMPEDSVWRQAQLLEGGQDATSLQWMIDTVLGSPIGLVELGLWMTHCPAHALERYHALIVAIRRLHGECPDRFMLDDGGE